MKDQGDSDELVARFALPVGEGALYLHRTHPVVEGLASYTLDTALDPQLAEGSLARRAGVIRTRTVSKRATVLLLRLRYHIVTKRGKEEKPLLAEDWRLMAYTSSGTTPEWLSEEQGEALLQASPDANIAPDLARPHLDRAISDLPALETAFAELARNRGNALLEAHRRVRQATRTTGVSQSIEPQLPVDVLGVYVYLPVGN
jgi:hypothetical protein